VESSIFRISVVFDSGARLRQHEFQTLIWVLNVKGTLLKICLVLKNYVSSQSYRYGLKGHKIKTDLFFHPPCFPEGKDKFLSF